MGRHQSIQSIQVLRFFAAAMVMLAHASTRAADQAAVLGLELPATFFAARWGVDIFFVISGFLMGHITHGDFWRPHAAQAFLRDRFVRIVPLYWILTCLTAALRIAVNSTQPASLQQPVTLENFVRSLLFQPYFAPDGARQQIIGQGWTLNYEMMFYLIVGGCLLWRNGRLLVPAIITAVFLAGFLPHGSPSLEFWSDPIIFEFVTGFVIASIRQRLPSLPRIPGKLAVILAFIFVMNSPWPIVPGGALFTWAAATILVSFCVLTADVEKTWAASLLAKFGNWSYSLYLTHMFVLLFAGVIWRKVFAAQNVSLFYAASFVAAMLVAAASYYGLERPIMAYFHRTKSAVT